MSQGLRKLIGKPELKEYLDYQVEKLAEHGYRITHSLNFDTHISVQVENRDFFFIRAMAHDGSREDAQAAGDECALDVLDAAWTHFKMPKRKVYRDTVKRERA